MTFFRNSVTNLRWLGYLASYLIAFNGFPTCAQQTSYCFTELAFGGVIAGTVTATLLLVAIIVPLVLCCCCSMTPLSKAAPACKEFGKELSGKNGQHSVSFQHDISATTSLNRQTAPVKWWGLPNTLRTLIAHTESNPKFVNELTLENTEDLGFSLSTKKDYIFIKYVNAALNHSHLRIMEQGEHVLGMTVAFQDIPLDVVNALIASATPYRPTLYILKKVNHHDFTDTESYNTPSQISSQADALGTSLPVEINNPHQSSVHSNGLIEVYTSITDFTKHPSTKDPPQAPIGATTVMNTGRIRAARLLGDADNESNQDGHTVFHSLTPALKTDTGRLSDVRYVVQDNQRQNPLYGMSRDAITSMSGDTSDPNDTFDNNATAVHSVVQIYNKDSVSSVSTSDYNSDIDAVIYTKADPLTFNDLNKNENETSCSMLSGYYVRVKIP